MVRRPVVLQGPVLFMTTFEDGSLGVSDNYNLHLLRIDVHLGIRLDDCGQ